jgi:hypothetical protein
MLLGTQMAEGFMSYAPRAIRAIFVGVLVAACAFVLAQGSKAATITVNAPDAYGRVFVDVVGDIDSDDYKAFQQKVANLHNVVQRNVIVTLASPGGHAVAAMAIGEFISSRGWTTYVPSGIHVRAVVV